MAGLLFLRGRLFFLQRARAKAFARFVHVPRSKVHRIIEDKFRQHVPMKRCYHRQMRLQEWEPAFLHERTANRITIV